MHRSRGQLFQRLAPYTPGFAHQRDIFCTSCPPITISYASVRGPAHLATCKKHPLRDSEWLACPLKPSTSNSPSEFCREFTHPDFAPQSETSSFTHKLCSAIHMHLCVCICTGVCTVKQAPLCESESTPRHLNPSPDSREALSPGALGASVPATSKLDESPESLGTTEEVPVPANLPPVAIKLEYPEEMEVDASAACSQEDDAPNQRSFALPPGPRDRE